ncbi:MAG: NYN domain-containing protein [Acidobacteria bacterium]|nr:NYN domain-containing protein [Acidobacteriota bacterium]MCY3966541.1 NYN domain-containing protein [Acidobacteriota bacterium]
MNPWWRRPVAEEGSARAEPEAQAVAEEVQESPAQDEVSALLVDAEATVSDADAGGDEQEAADEGDAGEASVSPALQAATEPAKPARATPEDEDKPPPARRRRRRRRRGGRGRGRGRATQAGGGSGAGEVERAADAGPRAASPTAAGRAAVLLDVEALKRSLGAAAGIDPEGLFARLDGDLGKLVLRRVYADARDRDLDRAALHRSGAEVVDVPANPEERGCSAAVRIVVDALELCYTKRGIGTMVLVASSVQMLPLVAKLQQNGVTVIGLGGADGNAQVRGQCDRFIDLGG